MRAGGACGPPGASGREHIRPDSNAGFFDPGFGYTESGHPGSRAVLEVRSHEVPFILEDGQVIGRLVYEKMAEAPQELYRQIGGSNYQGQSLKLSKHFRMP